MAKRYETASNVILESRSAVLERMKEGKVAHEKHQSIIKKIDSVLKKF